MIVEIARLRYHLRSAGITYQGAHSVEVRVIASSYASMYVSHSARSARSPFENFQCL